MTEVVIGEKIRFPITGVLYMYVQMRQASGVLLYTVTRQWLFLSRQVKGEYAKFLLLMGQGDAKVYSCIDFSIVPLIMRTVVETECNLGSVSLFRFIFI